MGDEGNTITIQMDQYLELKAFETKLPDLIGNAINEYKLNTLKRLHAKDKESPEAVRLRAKRYADKNRKLINEKRREKRKQERKKKAASVSTSTVHHTTKSTVVVDSTKGVTVTF